MVHWGRNHRDVASILFVEGDNHYVMDRSEEYALFMHKHLLDPWLWLFLLLWFACLELAGPAYPDFATELALGLFTPPWSHP